MERIKNLKNNFEHVKKIRTDLLHILKDLDEKHTTLDTIYTQLVKSHTEKKYLFGLDSFHFQNKLIENENVNMRQIVALVDNQIYCEYYKFYKIICEYVLTEIKEEKIHQHITPDKCYPIYKDLAPLAIYEFSITIEVHDQLLIIIQALVEFLELNESALAADKVHSDMGLHIDNLINAERFTNTILQERINLFINYLTTFHTHHRKYLNCLLIKSKIMAGFVNEEIRYKENPLPSEINQPGDTSFLYTSAAEFATLTEILQYNNNIKLN